eukprot:TRINITY_DN30790_c0_g1_i1.p1 TRINITY_DN30790_c0_g1~~TRINITY_DN30790_c0_g1_i1.p1  ORF type:complete len:694 (+),score=165.46 TRINITY_DN30790_c0_g1_i1:140-2083(+)
MTDTVRERRRKQLIVPLFCFLVPLEILTFAQVAGATGRVIDAYLAGILLLLVAQCFALFHAFFLRQLPETVLQCSMYVCCVGLMLMDWYQASTPDPGTRSWVLSILAVDLTLVVDLPQSTFFIIISGTLLWVFVACTEDSTRWGLYRVDGWTVPASVIRDRTDCADLPCAVGWLNGVYRIVYFVLLFLADAWITRGFALGMKQHAKATLASIKVAENVAVLLADYQTDAAQHVVAEGGDTLPPRLRKALMQLLGNLCRYRAFLPQSCLPEGERGTSGRSRVPSPDGCAGSLPAASASSRPDDWRIVAEEAEPLQSRLESQLTRKHATLLATNIRGYLEWALDASSDRVIAFHTDMLQHLVPLTQSHKGIADGTSGDRFYASLNGARPLPSHRIAAARLAYSIVTDASESTLGPHRGNSNIAPMRSVGVCSGHMLCGVLGSDDLRRYSFIGAAATWLHVLERCASRWSTSLVSHPVVEEAQNFFRVRLREALWHTKPAFPDRSLLAWELLQPAAVKATDDPEEWMYQLEHLRRTDPWLLYNRVMSLILHSENVLAARLIRELELSIGSARGSRAAFDGPTAEDAERLRARLSLCCPRASVVEMHLAYQQDDVVSMTSEDSGADVQLQGPSAPVQLPSPSPVPPAAECR